MSMSTAQVAIATRVNQLAGLWTDFTLAVEYENQKSVNLATQTNPYIRLGIDYLDGYQADLAKNPIHRNLGMILIEACAKEGTGTLVLNRILEHFYKPMQMRDTLVPVRTYAARPTEGYPKDGWYRKPVMIPFWFDDLTS